MAAQKRRGLGRGLQALIPDAQVENPAARPTDVFFPGSTRSRGDAGEEGAAAQSEAEKINATLLAPSKRMKGGKKESAEDTRAGRGAADAGSRGSSASRAASGAGRSAEKKSARSTKSAGVAENVSRETSRGTRRVAATSESVSSVADDVSRETSSEDLVPVPGATFADIPVELIRPNPKQPRQVFDEDEIAELSASIREVGLLQPIVVRRVSADGEERAYELIMGERRLRATKEAGLETIPAVVRYTEDEDLLRDALLENLHRVQLNPLEEAAAYQQLLDDFHCTQLELSDRIARSRSQISNTLRLMKLPPLVQRRVAAGVLSAGHARALLGLPDSAAMERMAQRIVAEGLSVRATEELVSLYDEPDVPEKKAVHPRAQQLTDVASVLSDRFDTRVKVVKGAKKGRITIEFAGDDDLSRILDALAPGAEVPSR